MEFVDNTGHVFSLPSFNEKPIGYEYEENDYVFWLNDSLEYRLSINNYYVKPIYFIYKTNNANDLEIKIYFNNSNVFKLLSPVSVQEKISGLKDLDDFIRFDSDSDIIKTELNNDDIYAVSTTETIGNNEYEYSLFPLYVIGLSESEGTWLSNLMIYINDNGYETWCPITIGGMFVNEYEELIINGQNMGISLPKDILKSIYSESIYNDEYNVELYNKKLKEYLLNYMGIRGELGNYNSVINSLKWFGYGSKISISKLFKTDNSLQMQFIRNYFHIEGDNLKSFNKFKLDSLVSLIIMINRESEETYPIDFDREFLMGENKPKLIDLINHLEKVKIGNHDMEIEDDPEKYFYWKNYFEFSFMELGVKLSLLKYYYDKYFLPIHLNVHTASLGYLVFANDIKMHAFPNINIAHPIATSYNEEYEISFPGNGLHYYTKQIHFVDSYFNEFSTEYIERNDTDNEIFYEMNDTCINIPIKFKNSGIFNCILLLERENKTDIKFIHYINANIEIGLSYDEDEKKFIYSYNKLIFEKNNETYESKMKYAYTYDNEYEYSEYFDSYDEMIAHAIETLLKPKFDFEINFLYINDIIKVKVLCEIDKFDYIYKVDISDNEKKYEIADNNIYLNNNNDTLLETHFSIYLSDPNEYENFILYPKKINVKDLIYSKYFEYWVNSNFLLKLCVNNKWYEYQFRTAINKPILDFGRLKYKYFLNDPNDIIRAKLDDNLKDFIHYLLIVGNDDFSTFIPNESLEQINIENPKEFDFESLYDLLHINGDNSLIVPLDNFNKLLDNILYYGMVSLFPQISRITDKISFNAYINDHSLVEVNNVNYDIDFYKIIKYHLDNNLHYLDGELINNSFFKYIEYFSIIKINDVRVSKFFSKPKNNIYGLEVYLKENGIYNKYFIKYNENYRAYRIYDVKGNYIRDWKGTDEYMLRYQIYLHPSLYGHDVILINTLLSNLGHNLLYAYNSDVYILREIDTNSNVFEIINHDAHIFQTEDEMFYILLEKKVFEYKSDEDCYVSDGNKYYVYDKLYQNEEEIYKHYSYDPNIIKNDAYLNNIHLFNIYERHYNYKNILQFNKNIDLRVNGVNFKYITRSKKEYEDDEYTSIIYNDEFEISGPIYHDIIDTDTRYPDAYSLYWDKIFTDKHRYQYTFNNLYDIDYWYFVKNLDDGTYFDSEKNNVTVEQTYHIVVKNLMPADLILKYDNEDDKYYTYNNHIFNNAKLEFTAYNSDGVILYTGVGLVDHKESHGKIAFKILETSNDSAFDGIYYINTYGISKDAKYRVFKNKNFLGIYISIKDMIEVDVETLDDKTILRINNVEYNLFNTEEENMYEYVLDEEHKKMVYFEKIPTYKINSSGRFPVSLIIEKDSQGNYFQYLETKDRVEYRKQINVDEGYYKYLYIQEEPYSYLNYGVYVKRKYNKDKAIDKLEEISIDEISNESLLDEYYYWEDLSEYTELGTCCFKKLDDFYNPIDENGNSKWIEDSKSFGGTLSYDNEKHVYKWVDPKYYDIYNMDEQFEYDLYYKIYMVQNGEDKPLTSAAVIGDEYDYLVVTFYYNKQYLVKNKYYTLNDFLESPYINARRDKDGKYYVNDKLCYVEKLTYYEFDYEDTHYKFILKEDNKFYDENNNIVDISIENDKFTYYYSRLIDYEYEYYNIQVNMDEVSSYVKYYLVADEFRSEVLKVSSLKRYVDYYGNDIKIQNPSGYWYDVDNGEMCKLDRSLNELRRYWFTENVDNIDMPNGNTIKEIEENLDIYTEKLRNSVERGLNMDNSIELRYRYKNYLKKDLTGLKGIFKIDWDVIDEENENKELFNLCVCITRNDDIVEVISQKNQKFELFGDEKEVIVYFRLDTKNTNIENIKKFIAKPRILTISEHNKQLRYNYKESGDTITIRVNNKEFKYGDNSSQNVIDLYNRFFINKYNLYDLYINNDNNLSNNIMYSIYEAKSTIQLDTDVRYDFYLMHDNDYWYGLYISRNTCDMIEHKNINIPEKSKTLYLDDDYALKYVKSSKEFLINRMKYISTNGYNHFNANEIICAKMTNNDRLPIRTDISAKWNIKGMSLGMNLDNEFESNAETTIIGLPKNDNKYQRGYYNITVRYSLDRDLQHQFKDNSTFRVE